MLEIGTTIIAQGRLGRGKGEARKLRRADRTPAIAYGPKQAPRLLTLDPKMFPLQRLRYGVSRIYTVQVENSVDGGPVSFKALIKEVKVDPISRRLEHVDLHIIDMSRPIRVEVPVELTGKAAGIIEGGQLTHILRTIEVTCLPDSIPEKLVGDVTKLGVGDSLHMSDLALPDNVKLTAHHDEAIAIVAEPEAAPEASAEATAPAGGAAAPAAPAGSAKPADKK